VTISPVFSFFLFLLLFLAFTRQCPTPTLLILTLGVFGGSSRWNLGIEAKSCIFFPFCPQQSNACHNFLVSSFRILYVSLRRSPDLWLADGCSLLSMLYWACACRGLDAAI
jgi:hypothetical protein